MLKLLNLNSGTKKFIFTSLMYPFSLIFKFLTLMKIFSRLYISSIPIICVGIYIGGTGKRPSILANDLKKGKKPNYKKILP